MSSFQRANTTNSVRVVIIQLHIVIIKKIIKLFLGSESNIFLYGSNGIFNVQNHEIKKLNIEGLKESSISTIAEDSNKNLWLGASGKVYVVNNFKLIKTIDFETDAYINEIFIDSRGIAWFGVFNRGLYYLKDDKFYRLYSVSFQHHSKS